MVAAPTADAVDIPLFDAPEAPPPRPAGKPHIPSFDDILFGLGVSTDPELVARRPV